MLLSFPEIKLMPDTLPEKGDGKMKVWFEDDPKTGIRTYFVYRAYRRGDGTPDNYRRKTTDPVKHAQQVIEAQSIAGERSLTSLRFGECVNTYLQEKGNGGFNPICYKRAIDNLGRLFPDKPSFAAEYSRYCTKIETQGIAINTVNNHKIIVRTVCNFAYKTGRCGKATVVNWGLRRGNERNRILSSGEELSLFNKMVELKSHLIDAIRFALRNPIRKRDLFNLSRAALKMESHAGHMVWIVQFQAAKTRRSVKITTLPNVDIDFVRYVQGLPSDCPWMFPMREQGDKGIGGLRKGAWKKIIDADRHFNYILDKAGIQDFHFHDLKHCAETYMLRQGYTYEMLRKLGIQTSPKTQQIYDNRSQVEIVATVGRRPEIEQAEESEIRVA